ncbi:MAG: GNAT family N-acetyltransferase [Bacteroidetes bacterium]|nr:GNAT family N-acetyltransferase [Bacteroidota bacterium]
MKLFIYPIDKNAIIKEIEYGSNDYDAMVQLRYDILRKPLNLQFTREQLEQEENNIHLGFFINSKLVACVMLIPEQDGKMRMKQVAVQMDLQNSGIGKKIIQASEEYSIQNGCTYLYCHARDVAIPFYLKSGYSIKGEEFYEVGILHRYMEKKLISVEN